MRPQAFYVLRTLAAHGGRVIDCDQLIREAWDGTVVSRHTVHVTIAEVRRILTDCGSWIVHQPKGGYCLRIPKSDTLIRHGYHFLSLRSREGFERALECFQEAAAEAPRDHRAFEGQANCHLLMASFGTRPGRDMLPAFLHAYERAVALVGPTPELRCNHAHAIHMYERRLPEALAEFDCVISESPTLTLAHVRKTLLLVTMGDLDAALESAKRAHDTDPLLPLTAAAEVNVRLWRREFEAAAKIGAQAVQLQPYFMLCRAYYGVALECSGRLDEALEQYQHRRRRHAGAAVDARARRRVPREAGAKKRGAGGAQRAARAAPHRIHRLLRHRTTAACARRRRRRLRRARARDRRKCRRALRDPLRSAARRLPSDRRFTRLLKRYLTPVERARASICVISPLIDI